MAKISVNIKNIPETELRLLYGGESKRKDGCSVELPSPSLSMRFVIKPDGYVCDEALAGEARFSEEFPSHPLSMTFVIKPNGHVTTKP